MIIGFCREESQRSLALLILVMRPLSNLLINVLAACVNDPFALLNVADCTDCAALALKKDASYISSLVDPLVQKLEKEIDENGAPHNGIVDLVYFDGVSNVQTTGHIHAAKYLLIIVRHCAKHVVSLFFSDVFRCTKEYKLLSNIYKTFCNIWGGVCHSPTAIFKEHSRRHNGLWIYQAIRVQNGRGAHCTIACYV
jgi:hypothetical protein